MPEVVEMSIKGTRSRLQTGPLYQGWIANSAGFYGKGGSFGEGLCKRERGKKLLTGEIGLQQKGGTTSEGWDLRMGRTFWLVCALTWLCTNRKIY